jgi:hexaprenyl-diphosphate synthase
VRKLVQDTLDYEAGGENVEPGIATGPVLFAREEHPELQTLIRRNLTADGDIELVSSHWLNVERMSI